MAVLRIPGLIGPSVRDHLAPGSPGERFAFLLCRWTRSEGRPVLVARDALLVPEDQVRAGPGGSEVDPAFLDQAINAAVRSSDALVEAHNHAGASPRFSPDDRRGLEAFVPYVLDSLPGRPYGATVWGEGAAFGEVFEADGDGHHAHPLSSITLVGGQLIQAVAPVGREPDPAGRFDRQIPWFTAEGQRRLRRLRIAVVGAGGTGSHVIQNLVYLGIRDFVLVDGDPVEDSNLNRLVTATPADIGTAKVIVARRFIRSVATDAMVSAIEASLQSTAALDALKGVDVIFGCVDNDGARLVLNRLALAYQIPYFDVGTGIAAEGGRVTEAGGRVATVVDHGPCLACMGEIDVLEARQFLEPPERRQVEADLGYARGMEEASPAVVSLNGAVATVAVNEFAVYVSGLRPVHPYLELDLLGGGRSLAAQWLTPRRVEARPGCFECGARGSCDGAEIDAFATHDKPSV